MRASYPSFTAALSAVCLLVAACGGADDTADDTADDAADDTGDDTGDDAGESFVASVIPPIEREQIDVLFVSDNSGSMKAYREQLAARISSTLAEIVAAALGGPPDLHVGVITSDMGTLDVNLGDASCNDSQGGELQRPDACTQTADRYLADDGNGTTNYTGTIDAALGCIVGAQTTGCGFEQPFAAVEAALSLPENTGFLRPDAQLVLVFLSDEDDCSVVDPAFFGPESATLGPIDSYRCFAQAIQCTEPVLPSGDAGVGVKTGCTVRHDNPMLLDLEGFAQTLIDAKGGDATKILVATFQGPSEPVEVSLSTPAGATEPRLDLVPSCVYTNDLGETHSADPALRLAWLTERFAGLSSLETICGPVEPPLARTANVVGDVTGRRACLRGAVGAAPDCRVFLATDVLTSAEARTEVPACTGDAATGCFAIVDDAATCGQWTGEMVELRGVSATAQQAMLTECKVAP